MTPEMLRAHEIVKIAFQILGDSLEEIGFDLKAIAFVSRETKGKFRECSPMGNTCPVCFAEALVEMEKQGFICHLPLESIEIDKEDIN